MSKSLSKLVFLASLPGAGGMLLQSILAQNKELYALSHSPFFEFFHTTAEYKKEMVINWQKTSAQKFFDEMLKGLLLGMNFLDSKRIIIDKTGTGPLQYLDLLEELSPQVKIVLLVRDLRAQFASIWLNNTTLEGWQQISVGAVLSYNYIEEIFQQPAFSIGLNRINEFLSKKRNKNVFILQYEQLCLAPKTSLAALYDYLEISPFQHDFKAIMPLSSEKIFTPPDNNTKIRQNLEDFGDRWMIMFLSGVSDLIIRNFENYYQNLYPEVREFKSGLPKKRDPKNEIGPPQL